MRAHPRYCPTCRAASFNSAGRDQRKSSCTAGNISGGWKLKTLRWQFAVPIALIPIIVLVLCAYFSAGLPREVTSTDQSVSTRPESSETPANQAGDELSKQSDFLSYLETSFAPESQHMDLSASVTRHKRESSLMTRLQRRSQRAGHTHVNTVLKLPHLENNETEEIVWTIPDGQRSDSLKLEEQTVEQTEEQTEVEQAANRSRDTNRVKGLPTSTLQHDTDQAQQHQLATSSASSSASSSGNASLDNSERDSRQIPVEWGVADGGDGNSRERPNDGSHSVNAAPTPNRRDRLNFNLFWGQHADRDLIRETQGRRMREHMDTSVDPCTDFYEYACGNWHVRNPIPKDKGAFDTFEMLREALDTALKEILEQPADAKLADGNLAWLKARALFQSCMNHEILEEMAELPLVSLLTRLGGWPMLDPNWNATQFDWLRLVAKLRLYNNDILLSQWVGPDIKNSNEYIIQFDQTTLGLPTRDYFLHESNRKFVDAYRKYMIDVAVLLGATSQRASLQSADIIQFETLLAGITSAPEQRRNVSELYHRLTVGELRQWIPKIDWFAYLSVVLAKPVNADQSVVIFAMKYVHDLIILIEKTPPSTVSNYLIWRFVRHRVSNLDNRFLEAKQRFYRVLFGREQAPKRWKTCVNQVNTNMGMALGAMFVHKYFDQYSKNDTLEITEAITNSFRDLLVNLTWISPDTKTIALLKIEAMLLRIGYPEFIVDKQALNEKYENVVIRADTYFENTLNILMHLTRVEQDRMGSKVNKTQWNTAPAVVNAYYSRNKNQIIFPAGILQPPFYHRLFPKCLNYGGIGVVIGHEITHGFDDKGRLFDHHGNLQRWWDDAAIDTFHTRAQCLIDQYSEFTVESINMSVDGLNTQGENIADNAGIKQAYIAYHQWLQTHGSQDENLPGINATNEQLFFLNFAQVWCGSSRPETARNKLKTTVHAPGKFRVIGTLSNSYEFSNAFNCPIGTNMNPVKKCSVW